MRLNSKVTWGLAWAGLAIVLAVPSADFLTGRMGGGSKAALLTSTTEPVKTASVTTTTTSNGVIITPAGSPAPSVTDPVSKYLATNPTLPDYISSDSKPVDDKAAPAKVAAIDPSPAPIVAPVPFPAPMEISQPKPKTVIVPQTAKTADPAPIVDESSLPPEQVANVPAGPVPPADIVDDSANWDTAKLRSYLNREGLLDSNSADRSKAAVNETDTTTDYDPNGFYLSDGPNNDRAARRARLRQLYLEQQAEESDDSGFTLF